MTPALDFNQFDFGNFLLQSDRSPSSDENGSLSLNDNDSETGSDELLQEEESIKTESNQPKRRNRRPPSTAAKRATHNAIERARRESLNGRFLELARALPNMANVKRPSKSSIVIKSLEYVYQAQSRERQIQDENQRLSQELESLRQQLNLTPKAVVPPLGIVQRSSSFDSTKSSRSTNSSPELGVLDNQDYLNVLLSSTSEVFNNQPFFETNFLPIHSSFNNWSPQYPTTLVPHFNV